MSDDTSESQYNIVTYNNTQYEFELVLVNEYYNIYIPHSNVDAIIIVDDLYNIFADLLQLEVLQSINISG